MSLLSISNLSKSFTIHSVGRVIPACHDVDLDIEHGEFVGITGRSGSGKSTILRCIYRTNLPQEGSIMYDSAAYGPLDLTTASERRIVHLRRYEIGYVSQFLSALPRTTAFDIVRLSALEVFRDPDEAAERTEHMLTHFDLARELWDVYPNTFSGGEKLRLNIAAAMVKVPRLLLLDEPTASLDNASKVKVREMIERLKDSGTTMLGIFHDLEFMEGLCDHEYSMQSGGFVR